MRCIKTQKSYLHLTIVVELISIECNKLLQTVSIRLRIVLHETISPFNETIPLLLETEQEKHLTLFYFRENH